jgi:hypothetical protein
VSRRRESEVAGIATEEVYRRTRANRDVERILENRATTGDTSTDHLLADVLFALVGDGWSEHRTGTPRRDLALGAQALACELVLEDDPVLRRRLIEEKEG